MLRGLFITTICISDNDDSAHCGSSTVVITGSTLQDLAEFAKNKEKGYILYLREKISYHVL